MSNIGVLIKRPLNVSLDVEVSTTVGEEFNIHSHGHVIKDSTIVIIVELIHDYEALQNAQ